MKLIDMHCDTISKLLHDEKSKSIFQNNCYIDMAGMQKAGTWIQYFACFVEATRFEDQDSGEQNVTSGKQMTISPKAWNAAWDEVQRLLKRMHQEESDQLKVIRTSREAEKNRKENCISAVVTVEEGGVLNGSMERLEKLYEKGIRLITLTWNFENCLAYPNSKDAEIMKRGLKPFGLEVISRMNELGMIIDVSHLSDGGFWDCIRESKAPIVASHSNARALCDHTRNLSDDMLRALADKGGVAGLNFYPAFLKEDGRVTTEDIARHARYLIETAGEDIVAIGTDFDGYESDIKTGYISHVSEMELVWDACKKAGITERQLDKITHENAWRVMRAVF